MVARLLIVIMVFCWLELCLLQDRSYNLHTLWMSIWEPFKDDDSYNQYVLYKRYSLSKNMFL